MNRSDQIKNYQRARQRGALSEPEWEALLPADNHMGTDLALLKELLDKRPQDVMDATFPRERFSHILFPGGDYSNLFIIACAVGSFEVVKLFLASPNVTSEFLNSPCGSDYYTSLGSVIWHSNLEMYKLLLADPRIKARGVPENFKLAGLVTHTMNYATIDLVPWALYLRSDECKEEAKYEKVTFSQKYGSVKYAEEFAFFKLWEDDPEAYRRDFLKTRWAAPDYRAYFKAKYPEDKVVVAVVFAAAAADDNVSDPVALPKTLRRSTRIRHCPVRWTPYFKR